MDGQIDLEHLGVLLQRRGRHVRLCGDRGGQHPCQGKHFHLRAESRILIQTQIEDPGRS